ncbi:MAG: hypothetical protein ACREPI_07190 [Candidatus Dormibacterales bacterium]
MLDFVVGVGATLLVLAGVAVMAGPSLPRWARALASLARRAAATAGGATGRRPERVSISVPNATSQRAILAAARLAAALGASGHEPLAADLRYFARRLTADEREGLSGLWATCRRVESIPFPGGQRRVQKLALDLRSAVKDRAEQLELLHFR